MKIIPGLYAVFWSPQGSTQQFHADVGALSPAAAVASFRDYFPTDIVRSIRGADGRFQRFKQ
jgi:hypothetical protein